MRLCDLPRNMRKYASVDLPEPEPKRYTIDEVRTLWSKANQRMRCFMALALNCGYGQRDIAELRVGEVDFSSGHIDRRRTKTGIRCRHKLWPITIELIKKEMRSDIQGDDRMFMTIRRRPLVHNRWEDGKLHRSDSINCHFWRLMTETGISNGRNFYCLRKTGASEIEMINPAVTEMYLAHSEKGMKRNYAERNWAALDRALVELGRRLGRDSILPNRCRL